MGALFQKPSGIITDIYCLHRVVIKPKSWKKSHPRYPFYLSPANPAFATPPIRLSLLLEKRNKKVRRVWGNIKHENHAIFFLFRFPKIHEHVAHGKKRRKFSYTPKKKWGGKSLLEEKKKWNKSDSGPIINFWHLNELDLIRTSNKKGK